MYLREIISTFLASRMSRRFKHFNVAILFRRYQRDRCQSLHNGITLEALSPRTTFSGFDYIFWSRRKKIIFSENIMFFFEDFEKFLVVIYVEKIMDIPPFLAFASIQR